MDMELYYTITVSLLTTYFVLSVTEFVNTLFWTIKDRRIAKRISAEHDLILQRLELVKGKTVAKKAR
jgi:hypothetical protein